MIYDGEDLNSDELLKLGVNFNDQTTINYQKTISGTGKYMTMQLITDDSTVNKGFSAYFNRIPINPYCSEWLNTTSLILVSPEYPNMDCTWIITASIGSTMSIKIQLLGVKIS